jgi:hypothetical protein
LLLRLLLVTVFFPARAGLADASDGVPDGPLSPSTSLRMLKQCGAGVRLAGDGRVLGVAMPTKATDADLLPLRGLTELEQLHVACPEVTDRGLTCVQHLTKLRTLNLKDAKITDAGLASLARLRCLRSLYLEGTGLTDAGLVHLCRLEGLRVLSLRKTRITDRGLQDLRGMKELIVLDVPDTGVTADGVLNLRLALPHLDVSSNCGESVYAREKLKELGAALEPKDGLVTSVGIRTQQALDGGLRLLWGLSGLEHVFLTGVILTPEHITTLAWLGDLKSVQLPLHEKIAFEDYQRLCRAMPGARINAKYVPLPRDEAANEGVTTVSLRATSSGSSVPWLRPPEKTEDIPSDCLYYRGGRGKDTIPVIAMHDWGGSLCDLIPLARGLQRRGYAVIVPELWPDAGGNRPPGQTTDRKPTDPIRPEQGTLLKSGCDQLKAVREFLQFEHKKLALNVNLLCILAEGRSGLLAANWADLEARKPAISRPVETSARDSKALVLLSPRKLEGRADDYLVDPHSDAAIVPTMVIVGAQDKDSLKAAQDVYTSLKRACEQYRPFAEKAGLSSVPPEQVDLLLEKVPTREQGVALLEHQDARVVQRIADFLDRTVPQRRYGRERWWDRRSPFIPLAAHSPPEKRDD